MRDISFKIAEVSTFLYSSPVAEIWPNILTAINAAIIQNKGPRRIFLAEGGDFAAGFLPLLSPLNLGSLKLFFCVTSYISFSETVIRGLRIKVFGKNANKWQISVLLIEI